MSWSLISSPWAIVAVSVESNELRILVPTIEVELDFPAPVVSVPSAGDIVMLDLSISRSRSLGLSVSQVSDRSLEIHRRRDFELER